MVFISKKRKSREEDAGGSESTRNYARFELIITEFFYWNHAEARRRDGGRLRGRQKIIGRRYYVNDSTDENNFSNT